MNLYVGTSGFSYPEWKGAFYPADLSAKQMLNYYGGRFRSVEINNTFHRMPGPAALEAWASEVPADFKFALKAPQRITHQQRLADADESVSYLLEVAGVLRERLGPLLFQLPPDFPKDLARLRGFLRSIPPKYYRVAFEFRHPSWFDEDVYALLRRHQAALCIAEAENGLEVPVVATADWGYLRLRRQDYGVAELKKWLKRVRGQDWSDAFIYFKHEDQARGPQFAQRFQELAG
jgi:uncharacterized protein YecE (DUF72 family)